MCGSVLMPCILVIANQSKKIGKWDGLSHQCTDSHLCGTQGADTPAQNNARP